MRSLRRKRHFSGLCKSKIVFPSDIWVLFLPDPRGYVVPRRIAMLVKNDFYFFRPQFLLAYQFHVNS